MSATNGENDPLRVKRRTLENRDHMYAGVPTLEYDDSRDEKPWQRVPCPLLVVLLGVYCLLGFFTQLVEDDMPRVIRDSEIAADDTTTFSEEAAWSYLRTIIGDGPRVSGTRYHLQKTIDLKNLVDGVASRARLPVRTDLQFASDDFWITFRPPYVNVYRNVSNVVALLEGESGFHSNGTIGTTLLLNCHYDSVPYAVGVSDNAIFCAVMLETFARLSRRTTKLKHNVVFLFNGAEENGLHASHGFLQHPWAKGITNVVNLDAAGMNGKPLVFQVTDPRLLSAYRRVTSRPSGQSIGEFLFASGAVPSDTDFRIWRDFGHFHGLDIAFIKWGHVYHTRYDHPDLVRAGVIQNAGDMILALTAEVADIGELDTQIEPSAAVYFDFLYWFMVTYSYTQALIIDIFIGLFGLLTVGYYVWLVGFRQSTLKELGYSVVGRLAALLAGVVVSLVTVPLMVATTVQLRYLSEAWIVVPLYWLPFIITAVCISQLFDAWRTKKSGLNRCIRSVQAQAATRLILAFLLLVMCCIPSLAALRYAFSNILAMLGLASLVSLTLIRYVRMQAWLHLVLEVALSLPPAMFAFSLSLRFSAFLLPIMARSHTDTPDYVIAALSVCLAALCSATVSGIELLFSRKRLWLVAAPLGLVCFVLMFVPIQPYRDDGPAVQRHYWFHSDIVTYSFSGELVRRETGVLITKHDAYTLDRVLPALAERGVNLNVRTNFTADCRQFVFCNMPLFRARFGEHLESSLFLQMDGPTPFSPPASTVLSSKNCAGELCTLQFVMTGQAHNLISIWPRPSVNVTAWSFKSPVLPSAHKDGRPVYVILESTPTYAEVFTPMNFTITCVVPLSLQSSATLDVSHHSHRIYHPEHYTTEYANLLNSVPKYFNIATFQSVRNNYVF